MNYSAKGFEVHDGVAWITFNRPETFNTINRKLAQKRVEALLFQRATAHNPIDQNVRVIFIRCGGRSGSLPRTRARSAMNG